MKNHESVSHTGSHNSSKKKSRARLKKRLMVAVPILILGIGALVVLHSRPHKTETAQAVKSKVPVTAFTARKGKIGIYVEALGAVTPLQTVTITSRVQGQIMEVEYREGQMVHKGDPLIEIDPRPYEATVMQAEGQWTHDRAMLNEARIDLRRYRKAYARKAIPKQQLDDQIQTVLQDVGTVRADAGSVENARVNLNYCHIDSPVDGRMGLRLVDPGNMVQATGTTALAVVTQLQPITVIFSVAEDNLPQIQQQLNQSEEMEVDAFDRTQQKKIAEGTFSALDNQIDTTTGTVKIRAVFSNEDDVLFPNQFVNVRLRVTTQEGATLVSSSAIQRNGQGPYVYVISPAQITELRTIKTGAVDGDMTSVEGVDPGEMVATSGFDKLEDGAAVNIQNRETVVSQSGPKQP